MVDAEIVREWLEKADEDFGFARVNLQVKKALPRTNLFPFSPSGREIP